MGSERMRRSLVVAPPGPKERVADRAAARAAGPGWAEASSTSAAAAVGRSGERETAPGSVSRALDTSGEALAPGTRADMERRFGHDFGRVRVHVGPAADRAARDLGAHAFTVGEHVVFRDGGYPVVGPRTRGLLAHELAHVVQAPGDHAAGVVHPYRPSGSFNFGKGDDGTLVEDSFDAKGKKNDKETKPWIQKVSVDFGSTTTDASGYSFWKGTAKASYYANPVKQSDFSFSVAGGSSGLGLSDAGDFTVHRIEGVGYNSGSFSGAAAPGTREGPLKRYSKPVGGSYSANMHYAVFYNKGEALHSGPLDASSHGCVHVDLSPIRRVNYHSVIGWTKVSVTYP